MNKHDTEYMDELPALPDQCGTPALELEREIDPTRRTELAATEGQGINMERERPPTQKITDEERRRRQTACDYGRASVGLSGFKLSQADEEHAARFITGEIDLAEFVKLRLR
ncbi:antitoxin VbhA family protein [Laribacter hongkongensis]|uniref:Antitoxin VbhA family protein n=1 Tax=Laribacter hongkongensis TaxID=168471 RepID=A0ABD4SWD9_9NEIS|nr:antitoxin VbhA family protein [Laribacter hongkongensis]MCG9027362.1 antitoxin VbhA family protein [Laribacter hongkongensis]MCG9057240.1 antitoxin VbhA family protein [Laribacter hongkongensis]